MFATLEACRPSQAGSLTSNRCTLDLSPFHSSVTTLTISGRIDVPALLQRLADLRLTEPFLFRQILPSVMRLPLFRHEFRGFHVVRFPIEVEYLVLRPQKIFRVPMAFKTPGHALRLRMINNRHVVDLTMTAKTTDAAVDVGAVIVKNIIRGAMDLHPLDRVARFPARAHGLEFRVVFLHLGVAVHARLRGGQIRVCRYVDETVAVTA